MGTKACVPARQDSFRLPPSSTPQTQWLRVQDQRRPRRAAPTFLLSSPRGKSRSSRKLLVSWKQNKLFSIKYQSYHRHHLIRISSCHKLQRAKKTKKNKILLKTRTASLTRSQKVIEKIIAIHSSNPSKKKKRIKLKMSH